MDIPDGRGARGLLPGEVDVAGRGWPCTCEGEVAEVDSESDAKERRPLLDGEAEANLCWERIRWFVSDQARKRKSR